MSAELSRDEHFMRLALAQAEQARALGEVPVGAVVVQGDTVIGTGHNAPVGRHDPTAHAEVMALRAAAQALGNYRLDGCELFVTLEPCAMCSGAMLHARLARVVFGAPDPKTGAAGSVTDLFAQRQLNHHTQVAGGVLTDACGAPLAAFFKARRLDQRAAAHPLRDDALRTPEACFDGVTGDSWPPHYLSDLPALGGLRLHAVDEGPRDAPVTWLCLHGDTGWSVQYQAMLPTFLQAGHRVVAPDLIGFGRSDKPKKESAHRFTWHRQVLMELIERLDLQHVVLVVPGKQEGVGLLGLSLPMAAPGRYRGLLVMNTVRGTGVAATGASATSKASLTCDAPFPDRGHRAALRAVASWLPLPAEDEGAALVRAAADFWRTQWTGRPTLNVDVNEDMQPPGEALAQRAVTHFTQGNP